MATTPAVYAAVQISVPLWILPHLATSNRTTVPIVAGTRLGIHEDGKELVVPLGEPGAWVTSEQTPDAAGQPAPCRRPSPGCTNSDVCVSVTSAEPTSNRVR
ncbi:hypothetical protein ACFYQA_39370 [Streptomyces sp. NPDC005774]|uniref:hypothetical protein n=1 Tax=Streptomyces sp. NPDC005774 TaxID=3364728 RepID=UPI0036B4B3F0